MPRPTHVMSGEAMRRSVAFEAGTGDRVPGTEWRLPGPRSPVPGPRPFGREAGFTMAGVIVIMAVMAIMLTVAVQTATFHKKRENELELIFRGQQFTEAVRIFRARNGRFPLKLEELVKAKPRVLRKEWKDPITGKFDWVPMFFGQGASAAAGSGGANPLQTPVATPAPTAVPDEDQRDEGDDDTGDAGDTGRSGRGRRARRPKQAKEDVPFAPVDATGPIVGVHSRSRDATIIVLNGRSRYCDWEFSLEQQQQGQGGRQGQPQPTPHP